MKNIINHMGKFIIRGLLAIIPLLLCMFAVQVLYVLIDKKMLSLAERFFAIKQHIPGLGILFLLLFLYLLGLLVSNIVGKQFFLMLESLSQRIPLLKTVYSFGKQLSESFSTLDHDQEKRTFKKAVLIKLNSAGLLAPGFVMGSLKSKATGEDYLFVLVPAASHPWTGFVTVVKASETLEPGWSVEECLKVIVSVGIVTPKEMSAK